MARELAIENGKLKNDLDANGNGVKNLAAPVSDNDAATKKYVDENSGVSPSWNSITGKPTAFPPEDHTHVKSEITDFPTAMPPTAHSHATDSWFANAINSVKTWATNAFAALTHSHVGDSWFTGALAGKRGMTDRKWGDVTKWNVAEESGAMLHADGDYLPYDDELPSWASQFDKAWRNGNSGIFRSASNHNEYQILSGSNLFSEDGLPGSWSSFTGTDEQIVGISMQGATDIGTCRVKSFTDTLALNSEVPDVTGKLDKTDVVAPGSATTNNQAAAAKQTYLLLEDVRRRAELAYTKPSSGIPKTDLASTVQTSLGNADSASQPSDFTLGSFASYVSALFSGDNTTLMGVVRYAFNSDGTIKDRAINAITYAGGALPNFPAQVSGYARDFLLNVTATATASDISLPESGATSVGDALAFEASHTYLVAITEIAAKHYYIRIIDTTPQNAA